MINLRGAEFDKPRVSPSGTLALMHLEQSVLNACVNANSGDALDVHTFACEEVLVVVAIVRVMPRASRREGIPKEIILYDPVPHQAILQHIKR